MELKNYLKANKIQLKTFCEANGLKYGYLRHISNKRKRPGPDMALKIENATKGKVNRLDLLYPKEEVKSHAK